MKQLALALLLIVCFGCEGQKKKDDTGDWIQLFNGKDLTDWKVKIRGYALHENYGNTFRVEDGKLVVRYDQYEDFGDRFGHIYYKEKFSSYLLAMEYRFTGDQVKGGPGWATR